MKYHFKVHKEGKGFWAECLELEGCVTEADSRKQLEANMMEALNLYLDEPKSSNMAFPFPKPSKAKNVVAVKVEPRIALAVEIRRARLAHGWTQTDACEAMGLKGLYSYQRLESAKTANPEFDTLARIKKAFPELHLDDLFEE